MLTPQLEKMTPEIQNHYNVSAKRTIKLTLKFCLKKKIKIDRIKEITTKIFNATEKSYKLKLFALDASNGLSFDEAYIATQLYRYSLEEANKEEAKLYVKQTPKAKSVKITSIKVKDISAYWFTPPNYVEGKIFYYIHGGGMIMGSTAAAQAFCIEMALLSHIRVLSVDYRLFPEHPHPAQIDDVVTVYQWLVSSGIQSSNMIIGGESAGGQLCLLLLHRLKSEGKPFPAGAVLLSPGLDLGIDNKTMFINSWTDPVLFTSGGIFLISYLLQHAKIDLVKANFDPIRFDLHGYPPILLQAAKQEMLYFGAEKFYHQAQAAGVDITFQVWDGVTHGFEVYQPKHFKEIKDANLKIVAFINQHLIK